MFDTSVVRAHAISTSRKATFIASIAIHTIAIVGLFALTVASTQLPDQPPKQLELYRPAELPAPPPPPPRGVPRDQAGRREATPPKMQQAPPVPQPEVAPQVVPDQTPVIADQSLTPGPTTTEGPIGNGPIGTSTGDPNSVATDDTSIGESRQTGPYTPGIGGVTQARVLTRVEPRFPQAFIHAAPNAVVVVRCIIDKTGAIREPEIVRSSFPPFNDAVLAALRQWTFAPGTMHGQAVDTYFELTVKFQVIR